ncbi:alkyl hydroperoxide reductase subunit F [Motiliproteus sp. SC1-56]|uniref:alkyl hydroperoxide reductase subunit F n=1 Tax=Motiliproteus sp. SC1-56 TaxID=2799565 RepID=UPI001A8D87DE|nr:alkyl hydroperoxide reductase subunit F [Motiliproteus sp. SC1-56]
MLDATLKQQLDTYLKNLVNPIALQVSGDDSKKGKELRALGRDLESLSDKITVSEGSDQRTPLLAIGTEGEAPRIRFAGVPLGHEFTSLVLALLHSGGHPPKVDPTLKAQIEALEGEYRFQTYVSLSCQNCPDVVQALNLMAALNPNIQHEMIDGALFQDEVESRQVMAVPAVFLNDAPFGQGRMSLEEILDKVDASGADRKAEALKDVAPFDMLVVGGGPAGAAAAIYAARKGIRTGLVAERFGGQVMDTVGIENFISVPYTEGPKLVASLEEHVKDYGVEIIAGQRAAGLTADGSVAVELASGATLTSRAVVLATGARWRELNVPGEHEYRGKGVAYCPHCDGPLFKGKPVAVVGGGNSGIEAAIDLAGIVEHVTVVEFADSLRADEVLQAKARALPNLEIVLNAQTTEVVGDGNKVVALQYRDRASGQDHRLEVAGIFVQIGLVPNTDWLKASGVELNRFGEIAVNDRGATNLPGVYAAGDATTVPFKQIIIAMGAGAGAALGAFDHLMRSAPVESTEEQPRLRA